MNFMDEKGLPVEIRENVLPKEEKKNDLWFSDEKIRTSGGFADAIFLGSMMVVSFMWGMLTILLK